MHYAADAAPEPLHISHILLPGRAQASAKHVVHIAKTFVDDNTCQAVRDMARAPLNDAEKALHRILKQFDLTLNVPITRVELGECLELPCLMPTDYILSLHEKGFLHRLLGGTVASSAMACFFCHVG